MGVFKIYHSGRVRLCLHSFCLSAYNFSMYDLLRKYEKPLILIVGCAVIPALFLSFLFILELPYGNLTALLDDPVWGIPAHLLYLLLTGWLCYCLYRIGIKTIEKQLLLYDLGVLALLAAVAIGLPYGDVSQLIGALHVVAAYSAFIWMNILFYRYVKTETLFRNIYILVLLFAFLHCLTCGAVTGIAEIVCGIAVSVMISLLAYKA